MKTMCKYIISFLLLFFVMPNVNSQNLIYLLNGERIKVQQVVNMRGDKIVYVTGDTEFEIEKDQVAYVLHSKLGKLAINECPNQNYGALDLSNYKGFLLSKGNNVYIPTDSYADYELSGALELKRLIEQDSVWNVVDYRDMAHFIIEYKVDLSGFDKAYITISNQDYSIKMSSRNPYVRASVKSVKNIKIVKTVQLYKNYWCRTNENTWKNTLAAQKIHESFIKTIYEIINGNKTVDPKLNENLNIFNIE